MPDLINPIEMYLKALLEMLEDGLPTRRIRIAARLEQSGPTVTKTVLRMERDGLVLFSEENKKLSFAPKGFRAALKVMRKHRIAECFLDQIVGMDWTLVHEEACRWEHVMSDEATARMDELLGHPQRSPYGNPIPPADAVEWDLPGEFPDVQNLVRFASDSEVKRDARIEWIAEAAQAKPRLLQQLSRAGAVPGARIAARLHGPSVRVRVGDSEDAVELPHQEAAQLFVHA